MKVKLLPKFIISLGIVGVVLTVAVSLFSYGTSKSYLEEMYAERVMTNSNAIAAMLDIEDVKAILAEGGDEVALIGKTAGSGNGCLSFDDFSYGDWIKSHVWWCRGKEPGYVLRASLQ